MVYFFFRNVTRRIKLNFLPIEPLLMECHSDLNLNHYRCPKITITEEYLVYTTPSNLKPVQRPIPQIVKELTRTVKAEFEHLEHTDLYKQCPTFGVLLDYLIDTEIISEEESIPFRIKEPVK